MRIVVVGAGVAGLTTAWLLSRRHEVILVEQHDRLGGHTNTVTVDEGPGAVAIDTGFIVYNEVTYPLFVRLLDELGIDTHPSDMSWSLSCDHCAVEYAGNARGLFARPRQALSPRHLRMLADIARFNRMAPRLLDDPASSRTSLGAYLRHARFSRAFADHYLRPMAAAIWSSGTGTIDEFPLATLLRFFANHGLLRVSGHLRWRTVSGGAARYIPPLIAPLGDRVIRGQPVAAVTRHPDGASITLSDSTRLDADGVVLATHADEALSLLVDASPQEKELLGAWEYTPNRAVLHTDVDQLPRRRGAWASWNYRVADCRAPTQRPTLSYYMNRLQDLDTPNDYVVTLNPIEPPAAAHVVTSMSYQHPAYTQESIGSQAALDELNGLRSTYFAGAYHRYGFHEDAVWSAVRVAGQLGVSWPA